MNIRYFQQKGLNFIEITNNSRLKVTFCDLGASIFSILFDVVKMTRNVRNVEDYKYPSCYYGKTIGRTSNRLKGHRYEILGEVYELANNEGDNVLHGGRDGLSNKRFTPSVNTFGKYVEIRYHYLSPHLESGYPGNVSIDVIYFVHSDVDQIDVRYECSSDMTTLLSLTNHSYFTLGDKDISKLQLFIRGNRYLEVDEQLLPLKIVPSNEKYDFSKYKLLSDEFDNFFYFNEVNPSVCNVSIKNDKYQLNIYTDFEGVQIYTSNQSPTFTIDGEVNIKDSVAVEPSDSFLLIPVVSNEEKYKRSITYLFKRRNM